MGAVARIPTPARLRGALERRLAPWPRFVVTGTGRCGTGATARLLTDAGIRCGHEEVFTKHGVRRHVGPVGDSSYLAVPHLDGFPGVVVHQVRQPLAVVRSLVGTGFMARRDLWTAPVLPLVDVVGDLVEDTMAYVVTWNERIERRADLRLAVERIDDQLEELLVALGRADRLESARGALAALPGDVNTRARAEGLDTWDDLPAGPRRDALMAMAERYGYPV